MDYYRQPYHPVASHEPPHDREVFGTTTTTTTATTAAAAAAVVLKGSASPLPQPHGAAIFPAELPSPVDGREPTSLSSNLQPDYADGKRVSPPQYTTADPAEFPSPIDDHETLLPSPLPSDHAHGKRVSLPPYTAHPADQPNPTY